MSFNLGDWAHQLHCEMCATDLWANLFPPPNDLGGALARNFWDEAPNLELTGFDPVTGDWHLDLPPPPDFYASPGMIDGTPMLNFHGIF